MFLTDVEPGSGMQEMISYCKLHRGSWVSDDTYVLPTLKKTSSLTSFVGACEELQCLLSFLALLCLKNLCSNFLLMIVKSYKGLILKVCLRRIVRFFPDKKNLNKVSSLCILIIFFHESSIEVYFSVFFQLIVSVAAFLIHYAANIKHFPFHLSKVCSPKSFIYC